MIILLFLNLVFASEWTTTEFYPASWGSKEICEQLGKGKECFEVVESTARYSFKTIQVNDENKPIYSAKSEVESCSSDCYSKLSKPCEGVSGSGISLCPKCELPKIGFVNELKTEVYCTELLGYEQKDKQVLELDNVKDLSYQAEKSAKAIIQAKEQAINAKIKQCEIGKKVIAMVQLSSESKGLSKAVREEMESDLAPIIKKLDLCKLQDAKDLINAINPDGVKITSQDKQSVLDFINANL